MTIINIVPPVELCDQHLLTEHRELPMIPRQMLSSRMKREYNDIPQTYTLGKGHMKFFTNKLGWLWCRYEKLNVECRKRGFNVVKHDWKTVLMQQGFQFNEWIPDSDALEISKERIASTMPQKPRYNRKYIC